MAPPNRQGTSNGFAPSSESLDIVVVRARLLHPLVIAGVVLALGACSTPAQPSFPTANIEVGEVELIVWVADETSERRQGLQDVDELPNGIDGMLFAYTSPVSASFSMRNTLIPLDIWWFDADTALLGGTRMEPCFEESCTSYGSPGPIMWAVETPAGAYEFELGALLSTTGTG